MQHWLEREKAPASIRPPGKRIRLGILAVRLVTDRDYRAHIRQEIEQRRPVLFDDRSIMGPFQDFLASLARRPQP